MRPRSLQKQKYFKKELDNYYCPILWGALIALVIFYMCVDMTIFIQDKPSSNKQKCDDDDQDNEALITASSGLDDVDKVYAYI